MQEIAGQLGSPRPAAASGRRPPGAASPVAARGQACPATGRPGQSAKPLLPVRCIRLAHPRGTAACSGGNQPVPVNAAGVPPGAMLATLPVAWHGGPTAASGVLRRGKADQFKVAAGLRHSTLPGVRIMTCAVLLGSSIFQRQRLREDDIGQLVGASVPSGPADPKPTRRHSTPSPDDRRPAPRSPAIDPMIGQERQGFGTHGGFKERLLERRRLDHLVDQRAQRLPPRRLRLGRLDPSSVGAGRDRSAASPYAAPWGHPHPGQSRPSQWPPPAHTTHPGWSASAASRLVFAQAGQQERILDFERVTGRILDFTVRHSVLLDLKSKSSGQKSLGHAQQHRLGADFQKSGDALLV